MAVEAVWAEADVASDEQRVTKPRADFLDGDRRRVVLARSGRAFAVLKAFDLFILTFSFRPFPFVLFISTFFVFSSLLCYYLTLFGLVFLFFLLFRVR